MKELHRALLSELSSRGLSPRLNPTGSHVRVQWEVGGETHFIVTSATPSDRRTVLNARADVRRQLKASGLLPETQPPKPVPLSGPAAHLRNELAQLRNGHREVEPSACARIRALEEELAWRQYAETLRDEGGGR